MHDHVRDVPTPHRSLRPFLCVSVVQSQWCSTASPMPGPNTNGSDVLLPRVYVQIAALCALLIRNLQCSLAEFGGQSPLGDVKGLQAVSAEVLLKTIIQTSIAVCVVWTLYILRSLYFPLPASLSCTPCLLPPSDHNWLAGHRYVKSLVRSCPATDLLAYRNIIHR